jgi:hypothetical protein
MERYKPCILVRISKQLRCTIVFHQVYCQVLLPYFIIVSYDIMLLLACLIVYFCKICWLFQMRNTRKVRTVKVCQQSLDIGVSITLSPPIDVAWIKKLYYAAELVSNGCGKLKASWNSRRVKINVHRESRRTFLDWRAEISTKTVATKTGDVAKQ